MSKKIEAPKYLYGVIRSDNPNDLLTKGVVYSRNSDNRLKVVKELDEDLLSITLKKLQTFMKREELLNDGVSL